MPAILDTSFAYEATTTDGGVTLPMCAYEAGALAFVFGAGDTGAPTWGCSNGLGTWNQLFALSNTASFTCWWKYMAASGESDVVLTATVAETYSGCLVVVRDVFQGYTAGSPPLSANATATGTRIALPTVTTVTDDNLVLCAISGSANAPSVFFTESVLNDLVKADGTAEGLGVGWFFKKVAGLTTAYNAGALTSGAGSKAVIAVRPPAGGSTVLPAYTVSDASILITPQPGIAWDSNTAIAATADTNFGTSIAGKTCNDGTVATAVTDIGLDKGSFMSFAGVTNAVTANQMSGAEAVVSAARYNIGTRNILMHFRHATPLNNQRLSPISSGRGVWAGIKSGATAAVNWKVWQVHGGDALLTPGYVQPIVINPANTDTIATNGTVDTADVRRYGFWTGGIGALTQQSCFAQIWAMDTQVVAGGTLAEPIDVPTLVAVAAKAKNRFSSVLQGANQMLCLQAIQFGNGGTDPLYLDLSNAAIEFPSRKNVLKKTVNYNGTDNSVGFTFYPGAGQTCDLRSAVFSSPSLFHLRFHASLSASAIVPTAGMLVIGGGDVQFSANAPISNATFSTCLSIVQNSTNVTSCTFNASKITSATLGDMDNISLCSFTSAGTGHAIEVAGSAGTISLSGNTFTGYAASNGSTGNEAIYVNIATGTVTINIVNGGTTPSIRTAGATVNIVAGAVNATAKAVTETGAAISNARVHLEATAGGPFPVGASVTISNSGTTATVTHAAHGLATNDKQIIRGASLDANNGVFTITVTGAGTYTYTMGSAPGSSPTGAITSTFVVLNGLTDVNGEITMNRVFPSDQPVAGQIRKSSGSPYYKNAALTGFVDSMTGGTFTGVMISDD